ncbi:MAG: hypothetical protein KGD57_03170 [Candidatus Lokiarchaeota archaeon]|nr:hypothetical protein [Candidatus Lokiarchaeota archaeon]
MQEREVNNKNTEPEFKIDIITIILAIIGFIVAWVNMYLIEETPVEGGEVWNFKVFAYLSIIFTTSIPTVGIGVKNRIWAYGYIIGFALAGLPFAFINVYTGIYTFITTMLLFTIMWLIFWKAWRSLSSIKTVSDY